MKEIDRLIEKLSFIRTTYRQVAHADGWTDSEYRKPMRKAESYLLILWLKKSGKEIRNYEDTLESIRRFIGSREKTIYSLGFDQIGWNVHGLKREQRERARGDRPDYERSSNQGEVEEIS